MDQIVTVVFIVLPTLLKVSGILLLLLCVKIAIDITKKRVPALDT